MFWKKPQSRTCLRDRTSPANDPFDQSRFARRHLEEFQGRQIQVSRPEDTILMKLRWAEMSGGSDKQIDDALGVYELQFKVLDTNYIEYWVHELKINELWKQLRDRAEPSP